MLNAAAGVVTAPVYDRKETEYRRLRNQILIGQKGNRQMGNCHAFYHVLVQCEVLDSLTSICSNLKVLYAAMN